MMDIKPMTEAETALLRDCADGPQPTKGRTAAARLLCARGLVRALNASCTRVEITRAGQFCLDFPR